MKSLFVIPIFCLCFMHDAIGFDKTKLPEKMPDSLEIHFSANYGMSQAFRKIVIKAGVISYDAKEYVPDKKGLVTTHWTAKLDAAAIANLYHLFVTNKFDLIKNDKVKEITYDAPGEGVFIDLTKGVYYQIGYGDNEPMSGDNLKRYQTIRNAITDLATTYSSKKQAGIPDSKQQLFTFDAKKFNWIEPGAKPAALTKTDMEVMENVLQKTVKDYNNIQSSSNQKIGDITSYTRQLIPYLNAKGEKEVWINYFCNANGLNWRKMIVDVDDGGSCYFTLRINLATKKMYRLIVNGQA